MLTVRVINLFIYVDKWVYNRIEKKKRKRRISVNVTSR